MSNYRVIASNHPEIPDYRIQKRHLFFFWRLVLIYEFTDDVLGMELPIHQVPLEFHKFSEAEAWLHHKKPPKIHWSTIYHW